MSRGMPMIGAMGGLMPLMMGGAMPIMGGTPVMTGMGGIPIIGDINGIKGNKSYGGNGMVLGKVHGMNGGMLIPMIGGRINGIGGMVTSMMKEDVGKLMMPKMGRGMVDMQMMEGRIPMMDNGMVDMQILGGGIPWMDNGMPLMGGDMSMMLNGFGAIPQMSRGDGMSLISGTGRRKGKY